MTFPTFSKSSKSWEQLDNIVKFLRRSSMLQGFEREISLVSGVGQTIHHQLNRKARWVVTDKNTNANIWSDSNIVNSLTIVSNVDTIITLWVY